MQLSKRASEMEWSGSMCMLLLQTQQPYLCTAMPAALKASRKRVRMRQGCRDGRGGSCSESSSAQGSNKNTCRQRMRIMSA